MRFPILSGILVCIARNMVIKYQGVCCDSHQRLSGRSYCVLSISSRLRNRLSARLAVFLSQATGGSPSEEPELVISYVRAAPTVAADAAQIRQSPELSNIAALNAGFGRRSYFEHTPLSTGVSNMVKIFSVDFLLNNPVNALCNDTSDFSFFFVVVNKHTVLQT